MVYTENDNQYVIVLINERFGEFYDCLFSIIFLECRNKFVYIFKNYVDNNNNDDNRNNNNG